MNRKKFLLGRPVLIASHASPAYRGKVGEVVGLVGLAGHVATVRFQTPRRTEEVAIPLQGLNLIRRPEKPAPRRSFVSMVLSSAVRAAFTRRRG